MQVYCDIAKDAARKEGRTLETMKSFRGNDVSLKISIHENRYIKSSVHMLSRPTYMHLIWHYWYTNSTFYSF